MNGMNQIKITEQQKVRIFEIVAEGKAAFRTTDEIVKLLEGGQ